MISPRVDSKQNSVVPTRNTAVIVLGMHRSGTSALAGLLHELGIAMGPSLMCGRADENEKGFWEHEKIVAIHDRLLAHFGSGWSDPGPLPPDWVSQDFSRQCQDEICQVLEQDFGSQSLWALKDPRMCRLMPLWMPVFDRLDIEPLILCIVRNPLEVAASLQRRDSLANDHALLLWLQYNLEAVESTAGCQRRFLTFTQLLEQGAPLLEEILRDCLQQPSGLSAAAAGADTLLNSELRHHVVSDRSLDSVPETVNALYRLLVNAAASGAGVDDAEWQAIRERYRESTQLLNPWLGLSEARRQALADNSLDIETLHRENEQLTRGLRHAEALVQERETYTQELDKALQEAQRLARESTARVEEREAHVQELDKALREAQALVEEREAHVQVLDKALQEAQRLVRERNARVEELDTALQEATRYVRQHETSIMTLTAELKQLKRGRARVR